MTEEVYVVSCNYVSERIYNNFSQSPYANRMMILRCPHKPPLCSQLTQHTSERINILVECADRKYATHSGRGPKGLRVSVDGKRILLCPGSGAHGALARACAQHGLFSAASALCTQMANVRKRIAAPSAAPTKQRCKEAPHGARMK